MCCSGLHDTFGGVGKLECFKRSGIAELLPSGLRLSERCLGAGGNHLAFMLGDGGKDVDGEPIGGRHIDRDKIHAALHQVGDEGNVAREPVEAGNEQGRAALTAFGKGGMELRAVGVAASALDLGEGGGKGLPLSKVTRDAIALRVEAEAADALAVGRNPVIRDKIRHFPSAVFFANAGLQEYTLTDGLFIATCLRSSRVKIGYQE